MSLKRKGFWVVLVVLLIGLWSSDLIWRFVLSHSVNVYDYYGTEVSEDWMVFSEEEYGLQLRYPSEVEGASIEIVRLDVPAGVSVNFRPVVLDESDWRFKLVKNEKGSVLKLLILSSLASRINPEVSFTNLERLRVDNKNAFVVDFTEKGEYQKILVIEGDDLYTVFFDPRNSVSQMMITSIKFVD